MTSAADGVKMADQATIVVEMLNKYYPNLKQSPRERKTCISRLYSLSFFVIIGKHRKGAKT